jgi:hypothetical protein
MSTTDPENAMKPIPVQIVEVRKAPSHRPGLANTFNPSVNTAPQMILPFSTRRVRAVISLVGVGVVYFGTSQSQVQQGVGTIGAGTPVQSPAVFELQSTCEWWIFNGSGTALVGVLSEVEADE